MTLGRKVRADISTENVKGLILINGGGAIALLAFLPHIIKDPGYNILATSILWSLLTYQAGLAFAVIHNHLRTKCSIIYEDNDYSPSEEPLVCTISKICMWLSAASFLIAGFIVFIGGMCTIG